MVVARVKKEEGGINSEAALFTEEPTNDCDNLRSEGEARELYWS